MPDNERSSLENIVLAGIGAIAKTAESAGDLLEDLVKKGQLTVEQGQALNEELKHNIKETVTGAAQAVQSKAVTNIVANMDRLTPDELAQIRKKMDELENTNGEE